MNEMSRAMDRPTYQTTDFDFILQSLGSPLIRKTVRKKTEKWDKREKKEIMKERRKRQKRRRKKNNRLRAILSFDF